MICLRWMVDYGSGGENERNEKIKNCCPGCGSKSFSKYGVDAGNGVTFIVFGCRDCKTYNYQTTWTRKKRKFR